jgi:hypothetical protein
LEAAPPKNKRSARLKRYYKYLRGAVNVARLHAGLDDIPDNVPIPRQFLKQERPVLNRLLKQYEVARKATMKAYEPIEMTVHERTVRIRAARLQQEQARSRITQLTGIGLMQLFSPEDRLVGES